MTIEIKSISGVVLYSSEATNLRECLVNAVKDTTDLRGANLQWADLQGANLRGANLRGADLRGANLGNGIKISTDPIQVDALTYYVIIFDAHMKIGCEFHAISDWWSFTDDRIAEMDGDRATQFWAKWKAPLQAICAAEARA